MRRVFPLLAVLLVGFALAPLPKRDTGTSDLEAMQGDWVRISSTLDGAAVGDDEPNRIRIKGDALIIIGLGSSEVKLEHPGYKFILTATKRPKQFSLTQLEPQFWGDKRFLGIYKLERDRLTLCSRKTTNEADRPATFTESGNNVFVEVFKRAK